MHPTADATTPELETAYADDCSSRSLDDVGLDDVGAVNVLGAMVEQRRRWSSIPPALDAGDADEVATQRRPRIAFDDDVFQKIR